MHELSVCQQVLSQASQIARQRGATCIERIVVAAGPLSGVEPDLLLQAFSVARAGTLASGATLEIERGGVVVRCRSCRTESDVPANRLLCSQCGNWQVDVIQGEDLLLMSLDLSGINPDTAATPASALAAARS
jgi:hydrogenase nickel incorporation protein HypA/HybF